MPAQSNMEWRGTNLHLSVLILGERFASNTVCVFVLVVKSCPDLVTPENGTKGTNETVCESTVDFHCNECYELKGQKQLSCLPNKTWTGEAPICACKCCCS